MWLEETPAVILTRHVSAVSRSMLRGYVTCNDQVPRFTICPFLTGSWPSGHAAEHFL